VRDIRDVVSGRVDDDIPKSKIYDAEMEGGEIDHDDDDDDLADDEEWEYYDVDEYGREIVASMTTDDDASRRSTTTTTRDGPINELLADARRMREEGDSSSRSSFDGMGRSRTSVTKKGGAKETIFEVISTIVTVDFFVVLALLAWFLAGIFCSYVLKDDAVQIAFNMNFERLTQPLSSRFFFSTCSLVFS
jgi:hypothetical protein